MSSTQVRAGFAVSPVLEETALRYGLYGGWLSGGHFRLEPEALEGLKLFGQPLTKVAFLERFPELSSEGDSIEFPAHADRLEEVQHWRDRWRDFLQLLSEENPRRLGREAFYHHDRPRTPDAPFGEVLRQSQAFLARTYEDEFVVREKKEMVVDYRSCQGNYLASIDRDELGPLTVLLDCSSQIASHLVGFNGAVLRGVLAHPHTFCNPDYRRRPVPMAQALKGMLKRWAPEGLEHVCFCGSGTESWEKAVLLAQHKFPQRGQKIVCFEGSFHGRTLLSLFSSWNPAKRIPFQLEGYETLFAEFPEDKEPHILKETPPDWHELWSRADQETFSPPSYDDPLLQAEVNSLMQVRGFIADGEVVCVSVEPLLCEGGDKFATNRFFQALRLLTRVYGVALIFDEVQTGFGLGGSRLWSNTFDLPYPPDFINLAKKCQVGAVLSSIPDPELTAAHAASMARGYYNGMSVRPREIERVGKAVAKELCQLTGEFPMVTNPRGRGLTFAFDLPDNETANAFINQRFHRGHMVYIAGQRTIRFRFQLATKPDDVQVAFGVIRESLKWLQEHGAETKTAQGDFSWSEPVSRRLFIPEGPEQLEQADWGQILLLFGQLAPPRQKAIDNEIGPSDAVEWFRQANQENRITWLTFLRYLAGKQAPVVVDLTPEVWEEYRERIMALEHEIYEPERQDEESFLEAIVRDENQVCHLAMGPDGELAGFSFAAPLKNFKDVKGPDEDPEFGQGTTLYSADIGVSPRYRGIGLGVRLKRVQLAQAKKRGFHFVRSRNRLDATAAMMTINQSFGSREFGRYQGDYGGQATAVYWSIPVFHQYRPPIDWSGGIEEPTGALLDPDDWQDWDLAAVNKNSLCNWWTPNMVRHVEWLRVRAPLGHLYLASGRDEGCDKAVKCLIYARQGADRCVSFEGAYWGHTTACARSLSDAHFLDYFPWSKVAYPACSGDPFEAPEGELDETEGAALAQIEAQLSRPEKVLGVFLEPVQERTGRRISVRFLRAVRSLCDRQDVPLVLNETASWLYRGSDRLFFCQAAEVTPDALLFYAGGQVSHVLVNDRYFLEKPLMLISTWDGDELSCLRLRHQVALVESRLDPDYLAFVDRFLSDHGCVYRGSGRLVSPVGDLLFRTTLDGQGHLMLPPLYRLEEGFEDLKKELTQ